MELNWELSLELGIELRIELRIKFKILRNNFNHMYRSYKNIL